MTRKRACDVCYRRKIQCSIPSPESPCEWCDEHEISCTFNREIRKRPRKRLRLSDVEGLFRRVEELESAFAGGHPNRLPRRTGLPEIGGLVSPPSDDEEDGILQSESSPALSVPLGVIESTESPHTSGTVDAQHTRPSLRQNPVAAVPLAQYWYSRGIPLLSDRGRRYMYSKTGQDSTVEKLRVVRYQSDVQPPSLSLWCTNRELWELPPKETVRKSASAFFQSSFRHVFPVLDSDLFERTVEEAYESTSGVPSSSQAQSIAFVFAVLSIFEHRGLSARFLSTGQGDAYAAKAQCILEHMMITETSIVGLQTVLALQQYYTSTGQTETATRLHAIACNMVCTLGGHTCQPREHAGPELTWTERQERHLRMLFWLCYVSDKDVSLRLGRPPLLTEEYCDLTIPEGCIGYYTQLCGLDKTVIGNNWRLRIPGDPGLCRLKEKIYRLLFSPHAFKLSDGELVLRIRQLDDDLENWRLSIPPEIRPKLSIPADRKTPTQEPYTSQDTRCVHLQLEYHHLVTAIHTTVRRCGADTPENRDLPDDVHCVIHSSCDLSLEASRSTITFLKSSTMMLAGQEVSDIVFYTILATISLFIDVLAHPQNAQSHTALRYLSSAIAIIQSLSGPASTESELQAIQETNRFITQLIEISSCAIATAAERDATDADNIPPLRDIMNFKRGDSIVSVIKA